MKFRVTLAVLVGLCCVALSGVAGATEVIYNNGGGSEFLPMWDISGTNAGSNQWTCNFATCTTTTMELDGTPTFGTDATVITWSVTSAPFGGTVYGSGTSALPQIYACDPDGVVCLLDFSFNNTLVGGTYYVNLTGVDAPMGWDTTSHPTNGFNAYYMSNGVVTPNIQGMGFKILGTTTATPEPSSALLLGSGVLGLAGMLRRRFLS